MRPYLIVDCYIDENSGATPNFTKFMKDVEWVSVRAARHGLPSNLLDFQGVVITGSAASAYEDLDWCHSLFGLIKTAYETQKPVLGVCFGHQAIAAALGGKVALSEKVEIGWVDIQQTVADPLLTGLDPVFSCFVSHQDEVVDVHENMTIIARSAQCKNHGFRVNDAPIWGIQFHPEMPFEKVVWSFV